MITYRIGWYPGTIKGLTQSQTTTAIIGGMQMWMKVCRVRFVNIVPGQSPDITFEPYPSNSWAMAAHQQTGRILFSTLISMRADWARMAFAHELGHIFGWGHHNRPDGLMHPNGSKVLYFDANEGVRTWTKFGKYLGTHRAESLDYLRPELQRLTRAFEESDKRYKTADAAWQSATLKMIQAKQRRDQSSNVIYRQQQNEIIEQAIKERSASDGLRRLANKDRVEVNKSLTPASKRFVGIRSAWEAAENQPLRMSAIQSHETCSCFHDTTGPARLETPISDIFAALTKQEYAQIEGF